MFESLTTPREARASLTQPVLALAIHAGAVLAVLGGRPEEPFQMDHPEPADNVIYVPAQPGTKPKVVDDGAMILAAPVEGPGPIGPLPGPVPPFSGRGLEPVLGIPGHLPGLRDPGFGSPRLGDSTVYRESELTDSPEVLQFREPAYPTALKNAGIGGAVDLTYVVDAQGRVEPGSVVIVSSDHPAMVESVLQSLGRAVFRPGRIHGLAVRVRVRQSIRFEVKSPGSAAQDSGNLVVIELSSSG